MVAVGRVARVHGLRGQVIINPETDFPESRFQPGHLIYRAAADGEAQALRVTSARFHRGRPIVSFDGIDSIEQAEPLAGVELRVPIAWLEALPAGTYYQHDLAGCRVETRSGHSVGLVDRVEGDGGASRLVVTTNGDELLVPLAADICVSIDVARKVIVIEPPDGLMELNRSGRHRSGNRRSHGAAGGPTGR
jgi:16S rRNA processing protein RimM